MNRENGCCFTGHRVIPQKDYYRVMFLLRQAVENKIKEGYSDFYAGGALGFDTLAAQTVLRLKMIYKDIRLHLLLPCENQADKWPRQDRQVYEKIIKDSDSVTYISKEYTPYCMNQRNRALVDNACYCIAYCTQPEGGSAYTIGYAMDQNIPVDNIAHRINEL